MIIEVMNETEMNALGLKIGTFLSGGDIVELVGDVGAGKTTLTKAIALGLGVDEDVQSPSFTISRIYQASDGRRLAHYDFYRLQDAGIMAADLDEAVKDGQTITVVEWANIVKDVLPTERLTIGITSPTETARTLDIEVSGDRYSKLLDSLV